MVGPYENRDRGCTGRQPAFRDFLPAAATAATALQLALPPAQASRPLHQGSYEWFAQRDFSRVGPAAHSALLPAWRGEELRGAAAAVPHLAPAQLYVKPIVELDASVAAQPGKRIGF